MSSLNHATDAKYVLTVQYFIDPSKMDIFWGEMRKIFAIAKTLKGHMSSDVVESTMEPGKVTVIEAFSEPKEDVEKEMTSKFDFAAFFAVMKPLFVKDRILDLSERKAEFYSHI